MAVSEDLLAQRNKLQHEILALESTLGNGRNIADLLSSDSDGAEDSDDSGHAGEDVAHVDLEAERQQIQREIEELEQTLGADAALVDALTDSEQGSLTDSNGEDSDDDLDLPQDLETCLQMNLVYQEVLKEKLADLDRLLNDNREQQKELEEQLSGPSYINPGLPHLKLFLGSFMKPYFKDKLTSLGPPANEETKERLTHGTKPFDEMKIKRWEPWQKTLLINSVVTDTMKRMLQPKLSKMEYITAKMNRAEDAEKEELQNQITLLEKDITEIRSMKEDQLYGDRHDDHDWDKISNIDFEGLRQPDDLMRFWQNYLHPSINKSTWDQDEIAKLADISEKHKCCHWEQIAESLGTGRTAFMCFQTYQRYIAKQFRKREWTKEEDQVFRELVDKMRIGNFIPYTQISYFMEGRESAQLSYRWTCVLDPSIKKGPWTKEEDELLLKAVKKYGCKEWWKIRLEVPGRTDNSCRERYLDCLRTDIKRGAWSDEEVELLKKLVAKYGVGKWAKIASEIPNRVDSQCLNKWRWMMQIADRKGAKRGRTRKRWTKHEPQSKRRRVREKTLRNETDVEEYDFHTESDTSENENEQVPYLDSEGEPEPEPEPVENAVPSDEGCRLDYVQPDMKEWIPACGKKQANSPGNLRTILVRVPNETEQCGTDCVRNTVLDRMGDPVKTYVGMMPDALQKCTSSKEHAMLMVAECDVKHLLICMRASVMEARRGKNKTSLSSCTNQNSAKNDEKEHNHEMESGQKRKPVRKPATTTQLSYDSMLAITPWIGNVIMPLPFNERQVYKADIVQKRVENLPLPKKSVFLLFLQALKVDADGCKKVIEARQNKVPLTSGPESRACSARKTTPGSFYRIKTVADILAEGKERKKHSRPLQSPEFLELQLLPQPAQTTITSRSQQQKKINATMILPQSFVITQPNTGNKAGTSHNVVQGILPLLQLGTQDASKISQTESGRVTQPPSCPTTSVSTTETVTETLEKVSTPKRRHKPTMKAQALMDNKRNKLSKKQATKKQQNSSVTQTVAVLPKTTAWILMPAGLMPVTEIQVQAPEIPAHQNQVMPNNVQIVFQPPVIVNQSSCVAPPNAMKPSNSTPDVPRNNNMSLTAGPNLGQSSMPSSISDNHGDSSEISSVPPVLPETKLPTSVAGSTTQVPPSETACNQNKPVTPMNPMSSLVPVSSSPVGTSQNLTSSCISGGTNNVPSVSSVSAVKSVPSVHPSTVSGPGPDPQGQRMPHLVSRFVLQQPYVVNQKGSLALVSSAGPCLINNAPPATNANITRVPPNSSSPNINTSLSMSSSFVNSPIGVSVGGLPTVQLGVNPPISPMTTSCQILPQTLVQQTVLRAATPSNPRPNETTFGPSLMFFEQPAVVKNWIKGNGGITLPGLEEKMPYLPPFVSSINTLTTLLDGRDSLLKSAVQLLPEEQRDSSEEDVKIAAVRKMVSERFKTNPAYLLLKARFLSCFTLPALLATINPCRESTEALGQENNMDNVEPKQFGDDHHC